MKHIYPLVSILMTAYNREKYIAEAIKSVLLSTYTNFELIIVDDCSCDITVRIAKDFEEIDHRIKVYVNEINLGDYVNRNKAASYAKGKYLKYVDSDDLIYPYALEVMVKAMEKFPEAALGITSRNILPLTPFPILLSSAAAYNKQFFEYGLLDYGPTGVIIKTDIFKANGMFSGRRFIGDKECWLKIAALNPIIELPPSLTFWRQHEGQEMKIETKVTHEGDLLMTFKLMRDVLLNKNCPLNNTDIINILKKQRKVYCRVILKHHFKTFNLKRMYNDFGDLKLKLKDFF